MVVGTLGRGVEAELRWVIDKHFTATLAGNDQHTTIKGPDNSFVVVPPSATGTADVNGYGGTYAVFSLAQLRPGNYTDSLIPRRVVSLYGTYTSDRYEWGRVGGSLGVTSVSSTAGVIPGAVRFPAYGARQRLGLPWSGGRGSWRPTSTTCLTSSISPPWPMCIPMWRALPGRGPDVPGFAAPIVLMRANAALAALSLLFFILTAGTFTSLGVVLPDMVAALHWDWSRAGLGYTGARRSLRVGELCAHPGDPAPRGFARPSASAASSWRRVSERCGPASPPSSIMWGPC